MCVAANAPALFCMADLANILNAFYTILTFHFYYQILYTGWLKLNAQYSKAHSSGSTGRIRMKFKIYVM